MEKKKLVGILILLLIIYFVFPACIFAETIIFKDGKKAEGKIIEKTDEYIKGYYDKGVTIRWTLDKVESIDGMPVIQSTRMKIPEGFFKNKNISEIKRAKVKYVK